LSCLLVGSWALSSSKRNRPLLSNSRACCPIRTSCRNRVFAISGLEIASKLLVSHTGRRPLTVLPMNRFQTNTEHRTPNIEHRTSKGACASSLAFGVRRSMLDVRCSVHRLRAWAQGQGRYP
jgi:hypothetical protein